MESTAGGFKHTHFGHDQAGRLLTSQTASQQAESFVYDGMGRMVASTDLAGGTTSFVFDDADTRTIIINSATGYSTTSTFNKAGDLVSRIDTGAYTNGGTQTYLYDKNGQLRKTTDATGFDW